MHEGEELGRGVAQRQPTILPVSPRPAECELGSASPQRHFTWSLPSGDREANWDPDTGWMTAYRLRIEVPLVDSRSRTNLVADAIDELGGDIVAVDLREVDGPRAIDEMVVEFTDPSDVPALSHALVTEPSVTLLSSQRCQRDEPANQAQNWVRATAERAREEGANDLSTRLRAACPMARVEVRGVDDVRDLPVVSMALARGSRHAATRRVS